MTTLLLISLLLACGDKDTDTLDDTGDAGGDGGAVTDGGADDGGAGDGGDEDGGDDDGGAKDGGAEDGGAGDGGSEDDADGDGWTVEAGDCDDANGDVHPEAEEICNNGVDDDCDDDPEDCVWPGLMSLDDAAELLEGEETGSLLGQYLLTPGDTDGDGFPEWGAWEDGATRFVDGWPTGGGSLAEHEAWSVPEEELLWPLVGAGDSDDDGYGDVWAGQPQDADNDSALYLLTGPLSGTVGTADAAVRLGGLIDASLGYAIDATADLTGDGIADVAAGAPGTRLGAESGQRGAVYLWAGPVTASGGLETATARVLGELTTTDWGADNAGNAVTTGDLDGDGIGDLVIGAWAGNVVCDCDPGRVYVFSGPLDGEHSVLDATATISGDSVSDVFGQSQVIPGDEDGDGYDDLWLGVQYGGTVSGARFVGPVSGELDPTDAIGTVVGNLLATPAAVGDLDGDGLPDVGLGVNELPGLPAGSGGALLLFEPLEGLLEAVDAEVRIEGVEELDGASTLRAPGDLDGDGSDELLIGALGFYTEPEMAGRIYLLQGPAW